SGVGGRLRRARDGAGGRRRRPALLVDPASRALVRRRGERLALLYDVGREHLGAALRGGRVVHRAGRNEIAVARLERPGRLAIDLEQRRALEDVAALGPEMRMAP